MVPNKNVIGNVNIPHVCSTDLNPKIWNGNCNSNILTPITSAMIKQVTNIDVSTTYIDCWTLNL